MNSTEFLITNYFPIPDLYAKGTVHCLQSLLKNLLREDSYWATKEKPSCQATFQPGKVHPLGLDS